MITLYTHGTANGRKASIMLEEVGLAYEVRVVDILSGEQFLPDFESINPNGKIPAIVDADGPDGKALTVFESGAILWYLAEKAASPLLPADAAARSDVLQWLMFQMANIGPMFGQYHHFHSHAPVKVDYAIERYRDEVERLYDVMDDRLAAVDWLAGGDYSIADLASFTWVERFERPDIDVRIADRPALRRWYDAIWARPATQRGMTIPG